MQVHLVLLCLVAGTLASEPNPPSWPDSVFEFTEYDSSIGLTQTTVNNVFFEQGGSTPAWNGQWSSARFAFLFLPGNHSIVHVPVGYYTSVIGTGLTPDLTQIGSVTVMNGDSDYTGGALSNFWRSAENFQTTPTQYWNNGAAPSMLWAASQACPLRRLQILGDLSLYQYQPGNCCAGYSSGGFIADLQVKGTIYSGSQQQYLLRNTEMGAWNGGNWNMVFVGCTGGTPAAHCSNVNGWPISSVNATPVIAEKPYIVYNSGAYSLAVPPLEFNKVGPSTAATQASTSLIDFSSVYVATADDSFDLINQKLQSGLHLVLTPGVYNLTGSIEISRSNTVVYGMGFPTLVSTTGLPAIIVTAAGGVRVSGILLEAGPMNTSSLLQWGASTTKTQPGDPSNPSFLYDCFARVGGTNNASVYQVQADTMVYISQGNVVIDDAWLWRADHSVGGDIYNRQNPNLHGLRVEADNVYAVGLASEHSLETLVLWNGENGTVHFFQSELPYDVTNEAFGVPGYNGLTVGPQVANFAGVGLGVYCYFRDYPVIVANALTSGSSPNIEFTNSLSVFLNGLGQITHVINGLGDTVNASPEAAYVCTN